MWSIDEQKTKCPVENTSFTKSMTIFNICTYVHLDFSSKDFSQKIDVSVAYRSFYLQHPPDATVPLFTDLCPNKKNDSY